jgi:PTH2 family peptidyl-tRNA hydrolase
MVKQVIVVRNDIEMGKGKAAAQVAHASLGAYKKAKKLCPGKVAEWEEEGEKKIVVKAGLDEILEIKKWADAKKIPSCLISDAGHTQLEPGTITALGLGPDDDEKFSGTEKLKLL